VVQPEVLREDPEDLAHGRKTAEETKKVPNNVGFRNRTGDTLYANFDMRDTAHPNGGLPIETETKSILVKDAVVILVAIGGLLLFYAVIQVVSLLANVGSP
jgi:hypothetical protein